MSGTGATFSNAASVARVPSSDALSTAEIARSRNGLGEERRDETLGVVRLVVRHERDEDARLHAAAGKERRAPAEAEKPAQHAQLGGRDVSARMVRPDEGREREPQQRARRRSRPTRRRGRGRAAWRARYRNWFLT